MIKTSTEKPPNWNKLVKLFGVKWGDVVVTWGDTCYCKHPVRPDLLAHESIHMGQQVNPKRWWKKYYKDTKFRIEQEIEAYRAQYAFVKRNNKDRNAIFRFGDILARDLSGPTYGKCISFSDAFDAITK